MSEEDTKNERLEQLVEFLGPRVNDNFKGRFNELSQYSKEELKQHTQKLEDWALALGVAEHKQLQTGRLLGILSDLNEYNYENSNQNQQPNQQQQQQQHHNNQRHNNQQPNGIFENKTKDY
ncbi:hypothetical protein ACTA71_006537 [Dictyostelium dimigraforme]